MPTFVPHFTPVDVAQWSIPADQLHLLPIPVGAPLRVLKCSARLPRTSEVTQFAEAYSLPLDLVVGFAPRPAGSATRYYSTFDGIMSVGVGTSTQITVFEIPPGSQQFWLNIRAVIVARTYVNEHKLCYCAKGWNGVGVEKE